MAVNKTTEAWPDEHLSDLDHGNSMKLIKSDSFTLDTHNLHPQRGYALHYIKS